MAATPKAAAAAVRSFAASAASAAQGRSVMSFMTREGSALVIAILLLYVFWGGYTPLLATPTDAMWHVFAVAAVTLLYVLLQALAAVTQPLRKETGPLVDLLVSMLPVMVIGYTVIEWLRQGLMPSTFQLIVALLASGATLIDVIVFTWFSMRVSKLAHEIVQIE